MYSNGFSYLLKSLKISPSKMAQALNVDRSLVSKWKNGSRKIDTNAAYFDNAIDFLIERNKELEIEFLEKLFSSIYHIPNNSLGNTSSLITSIKKFIFDDINNYQQIIDNFINNGSIYSANISIYDDEKNALLGILNFLNSAISYGKPQNLLFVFCKSLDLMMDNKDFRNEWINKTLMLLDMGCNLNFVYSNSNSLKLGLYLSPLINHKNCNFLYFIDSLDNYYNYCFHIMEHNGVFMSSSQIVDNETQFYSALFKDPISIKFYTGWGKNILSRSYPTFYNVSISEVLDKFEVNNIQLPNKDSIKNSYYNYGSFPLTSIMSDKLYYEILCNSVDNEIDREFYFNCFKSIKNSLHKNPNFFNIDFYSINDLIEFSNKESIIYESMSDIAPNLILTKEQFKSHISCLIDYLLNTDSYNICLIPDISKFNNNLFYCWCKKNEFLLVNNNNNFLDSKFTTNTPLVNSVSLLLENTYLNTPDNFKSKEYIANFLKSL